MSARDPRIWSALCRSLERDVEPVHDIDSYAGIEPDVFERARYCPEDSSPWDDSPIEPHLEEL